MLTAKAKTLFVTPSHTILSEKSPLEKAKDAEAGKRLLHGRIEPTVTRLLGEIDAAKAIVKEAQDLLTERMVEGMDTTAAADALLRAENHLPAMESALTIARQKLEQMKADRRIAEQQVQREALRELLIRLNEAGRVVDACGASLAQALSVACPLMDDARAFGFDLINLKLNDAQTFFRQWVLDLCGVYMRGCATGLDVFVKRASWTETLPDEHQADHVRFSEPPPKPIPGWQKVED